MKRYDVVIGGGGISGLLAAITVVKPGIDVLLLEEKEIGWKPCSGLTTLTSLKDLGIPPLDEFTIRGIEKGYVHIGGKTFEFDLRRFNLLVLDRPSLDRYLAKRAVGKGVELVTGEKILQVKERGTVIKTDKRTIETKFFIEARGSRMYALEKLPAHQHTITSEDLPDGIEIWIDKKMLPDFFGWFIPTKTKEGKLGAAGADSLRFIDETVAAKGFTILKAESAPIVVGGPVKTIVSGHKVIIGDAAGQAKPTTGGGIYPGGRGGILAGKWVLRALEKGDPSLIEGYQKAWENELGRELKSQKILRKIFLRLNEKQIIKLLELLPDLSALNESHFNKHTAILKVLPIILKMILQFLPDLNRLDLH